MVIIAAESLPVRGPGDSQPSIHGSHLCAQTQTNNTRVWFVPTYLPGLQRSLPSLPFLSPQWFVGAGETGPV
jgi:hypothetical protein